MRHDDGYEWPTYFEAYGRFPHTDLYPVPIRCGLLASSSDPGDCVMAIGINDEEPAMITVDAASQLRKMLGDVASEYTSLTRRNEANRLNAAQRLLGDTAVVLSDEQWQTILTALSSDDRTTREQVMHDVKSWAPGTDTNIIEPDSPSSATSG